MRSPAKIKHGVRCCASANVLKCTGCPYQGFSGKAGCRTQLFKDTQDYLKAIRKSAARIETMTKQFEFAQPKWISVEDRLPEENKPVLVFDELHGVGISFHSRYTNSFVGLSKDVLFGSVTHWMPLPPGPNDNKEEQS